MNRPNRILPHPCHYCLLLAFLLMPGLLPAQSGFPATHIARMYTISSVPSPDRAAAVAIFNLDRATGSARFRISITNSSSPITQYLLVRHSPDGSSEVLRALPPLSYELTETGTLTSLDEGIFDALDSMMLYLEIRSETYPDGFISGNISVAPNVVSTEFNGERITPRPEGSGRGDLSMIVDRATGKATYSMFWNRLSGPAIEVQFHRAPFGQEGPLIHALGDLKGDSVLIERTWDGISQEDMEALASGGVYVVVTTAKYPGGEIASQLAPVDVFAAAIEPEQEVPPVTGSQSSGTGYLIVSSSPGFGHFFKSVCAVHGTVDTIDEAHLHRGPIGEDGPVILPLTKDYFNSWELEESVLDPAIPPAVLADIRAGNSYVNFHTKSYPDGELRGQMIPSLSNLTLVAAAPLQTESTENKARAYFDPRTNRIRFDLDEEARGEMEVKLFSSLGDLVGTGTLEEHDGAIPAENLRAGLYLAQVVVKGRVERVIPVTIVR